MNWRSQEAAWPTPLKPLLRTGFEGWTRNRGEPGTDAAAGRAVHTNTLLWGKAHDSMATPGGASGQSEESTATVAEDWALGHLSRTINKQAVACTSGLPIFAQRRAYPSGESGLEFRYHIHKAAERVLLPGGCDRLVLAVCPLLGGSHQPGGTLLP